MTAEDLRKAILQQAIQGKLLPQDPNDEPASKLLERIREEKACLVKEKKIKKDKNESIIYRGEDNSHYEKFADGTIKCIDDEIPFEIPQSWEWVRLNELALYRKGPFGSSLTKFMFVPKSDTSVKVYEQKNAIQKDFTLGEYYISQEKFKTMKSFIVKPLDIIVSCAGTIGETYVLPQDAPVGVINQALMRISLFDMDICDYYLLYFDYILKKQAQLLSAGSAIKNIPPFEILKNMLMPIPPIQEQRRIIKKNKVIQFLIEKYRVVQEQIEEMDNSLNGLLKKSILQYAIQGKLVPQNSNEEPASALLEKIQQEKLQLLKDGKLKKKDLDNSAIFKGDDNKYFEKKGNEVVCIDDEIPFEIPDSWEWVRFKNVAIIARGGSPRPIKSYLTENPNGVNWIKIGDTEKGGKYINSVKEKIKPEGVSSSRMVHKGDFLLTNSMSFGRPYITNVDGCIHDGWLVISPFANTFIQDYLFHLLSSAFAYNQFSGKVSGAVVKNLNIDKVLDAIIPLPPLQEQKRIVMALDNVLASIMRN